MALMVDQRMKEQIENFDKNFKSITVYLRSKKNDRLIGCLIGYLLSGKIMIGWSKCNSKLDKFDKVFARYLALQRVSANLDLTSIPREVRYSVGSFRNRLEKYFKINKSSKTE